MTLKLQVEYPDFAKRLEQDIFDIKKLVVDKDVPQFLKRMQQQENFPTDPDDYTLFLRNRGRETKRKLQTIRPQYLKIGTKTTPLSFRFVANTSSEEALEAVKYAYSLARKRAPVRTGEYFDSIVTSTRAGNFEPRSARASDFSDDTRFYVSSATAYSAIIEAGFYTKYYKTERLPQGIFYWVTLQVRKKFGNKISIRFFYLSGSGGRGTWPVIEIGRAGLFAGRDKRPGKAARRRRRAR